MKNFLIIMLGLIISPIAFGHGTDHGNYEPHIKVPKLEPNQTSLGVFRDEPVAIQGGDLHESPALTVSPTGEVFVATVQYLPDTDEENITVRRANNHSSTFDLPIKVSSGKRVWHPRLASSVGGNVWITWCEKDSEEDPINLYERTVYLRQVHPLVGHKIKVSTKAGRSCDPVIAIDAIGDIHIAWEQSLDKAKSRIAYSRFSSKGQPRESETIISKGSLDRRPAILSDGVNVHVAWDSWVNTTQSGDTDPDYDIYLRTLKLESWKDIQVVDNSVGIQASPNLAKTLTGGIYIAYHATNHSLIKWWKLRHVKDQTISELDVTDELRSHELKGQMQGAEFPSIVNIGSGRIFAMTRPSQGAYLHWIDGKKVETVNITRKGWGARGIKSQIAVTPDGTILATRRARHDSILEKFKLKKELKLPKLIPVKVGSKLVAEPRTRIQYEGVVFGDVHMHSAVSDGTGSPDEIYARAWVRGHDFAILTDHDNIVGSRMLPSEHAEIAWLTDFFNATPNFVTIHAYEWTTRPTWKDNGSGHRNIYFKSKPPETVYSKKNGYGDTKSLFNILWKNHAREVFAVPHHTGWTGTDWDNADELIQRHVEIVSVHGAYETLDFPALPQRGKEKGMFVVDGLKKGLKFGFLGSSDGHGLLYHHGVGRRRDPWADGMTGVLTSEKNRESIWQALYDRKTFSTSGPRMNASIHIDGIKMGQEGKHKGPLYVSYSIEATEKLTEVLIVRDGTPIHKTSVIGKKMKGMWRDYSVTKGPHSYYIRASQESETGNKDVVWTSPVFVDVN